jgi:hypothetical protein
LALWIFLARTHPINSEGSRALLACGLPYAMRVSRPERPLSWFRLPCRFDRPRHRSPPQSPPLPSTSAYVPQIILALGVTYAAVPLYRAFCSATGFAGVPTTDPARFSPDRLYTTPDSEKRKRITVHFEATSADTLPWTFEPQQRSVKVLPGETALAFYTAKNTGDKDLIGIATYNMTPEKVSGV